MINNTPHPLFTSLIASYTTSGVGDVNTAPATAASSIPYPTNPPCAGSCPLPPPLTNPTFLASDFALTNIFLFSLFLTYSGCANTIPSNISSTTTSGLLINFFIDTPCYIDFKN